MHLTIDPGAVQVWLACKALEIFNYVSGIDDASQKITLKLNGILTNGVSLTPTIVSIYHGNK